MDNSESESATALIEELEAAYRLVGDHEARRLEALWTLLGNIYCKAGQFEIDRTMMAALKARASNPRDFRENSRWHTDGKSADELLVVLLVGLAAGPKLRGYQGEPDTHSEFEEALLRLRLRDGFSNAERLKGQTGDAYIVQHLGRTADLAPPKSRALADCVDGDAGSVASSGRGGANRAVPRRAWETTLCEQSTDAGTVIRA